MALYDELASVVGQKYCTDKDYICVSYSRGLDPVLPEIIPQIALRPENTEEVQQIVEICNKYETPLLPRGGGCGLMGGSKPISEDTVLLDLSRMKRIINIDEDNHVVTAQAGISWSQLNSVLFDKGFYTGNMGPGSGLNAAIGGGMSHHSGGGGGCAKYGKCTDNCVGLEIVLGNGELITFGSQENQFVEKPYCKLGLGPDLMGIFLGDNGTMGIKTTVSLKIYPKPPYFSGKTWHVKDHSYDYTQKMIIEMVDKGWSKDLGIYDFFFTHPPSVMGITTDNLIKSWGDISGGVVSYVHEAFDQQVLERNAEILENIAKKHSQKELGPSPEEGNVAEWFYGEQGHWQFYHQLFSLMGPDFFACTTEVMVPISRFPEILRKIDEWEEDKREELFECDAESGVSHVVMLNHNSCYIGSGLAATHEPDYKEDVIELWKDQLEMLSKTGACLYMCGQIGSQVLVDSNIYEPNFYNFMKNIKKICDPNGIISPGKFRL
ncbi:MAG: FAD-binding protein [Candidatus Lokiarchaeota archaeon]|nr:FAD-binding protein [Candidatus Lokiarchaeota archaeon]